MSVYFISGKPRGGKSFFAVKKIVDELVLTERVVITNVALKLPELNEYLQAKYPHKLINLFERIVLLDDATQTGRFWLLRPRGWCFKEQGDRLDFSRVYRDETRDGVTVEECKSFLEADLPAVLYVIDEIHTFFNAREWMRTGKSALFYLSQHAKLGDDLFCITQSIHNVDKQFRSVAQEFIYVRNHAKERLGWFRSLNGFTRAHYLQPVTGTSGEKAMETGYFKLDVSGLAACYDTARGVGIIGRDADKHHARRGLPIWLLVLLVLLLAIGIALLPRALAGGLNRAAHLGSATLKTNANVAAPVLSNRATDNASGITYTHTPPPNTSGIVAASVMSHAPATERALVGIAVIGRTGTAYFSDGTSFDTDNPRVRQIGRDYVILDNIVYHLRTASPAPDAAHRAKPVWETR